MSLSTPAIPASRVNPLSIAPMMRRTDRHYRYMMRLITRHTLLYTEMVTCGAILHGNRARFLDYSEREHPLALQLGGDNPREMAECAKIAQDWGYDEVNINVGCPSDRVQNGHFGACLMAQPETVAHCVAAMRDAVDIEVTVKHRIGIDDIDRYEDMERFVEVVARAGCRRFTVHARKAWLSGLSPAENRNVPPLRYQDVYRLKETFPDLHIEINGGITTIDQARAHLRHVDAVMIGRGAYDVPYGFADADHAIYGDDRRVPTRQEIVHGMAAYAEEQLAMGCKLSYIARPLLNLFHGQPGAARWRRYLTENGHRKHAGTEVLVDALAVMDGEDIAAE